MGLFDVPRQELIERTAEKLKELPQIKAPEWAMFAKTGAHNERQPTRQDWWHIRAAAILTKIFTLGPVGVSKLRTKFGGKKNKGFASERFYKSGGNNIRKILQQLEKSGLAKNITKGIHKGRVISPQGLSLLEKASNEIMKQKGIIIPKKPDAAQDAKPAEQVSSEQTAEKKQRGRKKKEAVAEVELNE